MNTTYFLNLVAGNVFQSKTNPGIPTTYYVGLSTTAPTVSGSNVTEPAGGGYERVPVTGSDFNVPSSGTVTNKNTIVFPDSITSWGTVTHYLIYDAASGGHLLMYGALSTSQSVDGGVAVALRAGALSLGVFNPS